MKEIATVRPASIISKLHCVCLDPVMELSHPIYIRGYLGFDVAIIITDVCTSLAAISSVVRAVSSSSYLCKTNKNQYKIISLTPL